MSRKKITAADGLRAQIFHEDGKGMRGITLLNASGPRGMCLHVAVHSETGRRKGVNSLSLKGTDFKVQWGRAVAQIAEYYGIQPDDGMYSEMIAASEQFLARYNLKLETFTITYQQVAA